MKRYRRPKYKTTEITAIAVLVTTVAIVSAISYALITEAQWLIDLAYIVVTKP